MKTFFRCPGCSRKLGVDDSQAGKLGNCPECAFVFMVPDESEPEFGGSRKSKPKGKSLGAGSRANSGALTATEEDSDSDEFQPKKEKPRRPKSKKARLKERKAQINKRLIYYAAGMVALFLVSFVVKELQIVFLGLALIPWICSGIWLTALAFQEEWNDIILSIIFPYHGYEVMYENWDKYRTPFLLNLLSSLFLVLPIGLLILMMSSV